MSSELLKSACFTLLKKKQDRQFDHQERVKRRTFNPPVNLHIGPGLSSPFPNTYKYLPSIHERTLSPDLKAGRTFSIFHPQHQSLGKTQVFQANLQPQTWTRPSSSKSANSRSYADEICNMISRSVHPDPVGVGARSSAVQVKQTHLRQLEGRVDEASLPTRIVTSNTRNASLPTQQTKHRYPSPEEPSVAGTSRNISHRDQHSIFPAKDTVAILQSIRQDRRRESIFRDAMTSLRKQDLHEKGLADLYDRFRLASRKVEFGSAHAPFAVMGIGNIN